MTPEDRLREAMDAYASQVPADPGAWTGIESRLGTPSPTRGRSFLVIAAALVAVVVAVAVLLSDRDHQEVGTLPADGSTVTSPEPSSSPTMAPEPGAVVAALPPLPADAPATFVASRDDNTELVVVDSATGRVERTLIDLGPRVYPGDGVEGPGSGYIDGISITPDGEFVYYSKGPEPAVGTIYRVATSGGEPEMIADGAYPKVSPDGKRLAYMAGNERLVVRDLATGVDTEYVDDNSYPFFDVTGWSADGRYVFTEGTPIEGGWTAEKVDTSRRGDAAAALSPLSRDPSHVEVPNAEAESLASAQGRAVDGLVGVIEVCCPGPEGTGPRPGGETFAVLDLVSGLVRGRIALPFVAADAVYDTTGKHQLFVATDGHVYRRSSGTEFAQYGLAGVGLVDW